jgi:hypothetical protein
MRRSASLVLGEISGTVVIYGLLVIPFALAALAIFLIWIQGKLRGRIYDGESFDREIRGKMWLVVLAFLSELFFGGAILAAFKPHVVPPVAVPKTTSAVGQIGTANPLTDPEPRVA